MFFVELIHGMVLSNRKREGKNQVIEALLQHDGLLESFIQWGYWDAEHRPDIVNELVGAYDYGGIDKKQELIINVGREVPIVLVGGNGVIISSIEGKNRVHSERSLSNWISQKKSRLFPSHLFVLFHLTLKITCTVGRDGINGSPPPKQHSSFPAAGWQAVKQSLLRSSTSTLGCFDKPLLFSNLKTVPDPPSRV